MLELQRQLEEAGGTVALHSRLLGGTLAPGGVTAGRGGGSGGGRQQQRAVLRVRDEGSGEEMELEARMVVNAGGLHAQVLQGDTAPGYSTG